MVLDLRWNVIKMSFVRPPSIDPRQTTQKMRLRQGPSGWPKFAKMLQWSLGACSVHHGTQCFGIKYILCQYLNLLMIFDLERFKMISIHWSMPERQRRQHASSSLQLNRIRPGPKLDLLRLNADGRCSFFAIPSPLTAQPLREKILLKTCRKRDSLSISAGMSIGLSSQIEAKLHLRTKEKGETVESIKARSLSIRVCAHTLGRVEDDHFE